MRIYISKDTPTYRQNLRKRRDELLIATDPWMLPDRGLTEAQTVELITYRQALRDMTLPVSALDWTLPTPPSFLSNLPLPF